MGKLIKRFQTTAQRLAYETSSDYRRPYLANCATETAQYGGKSNVTHYNQRYIEFEDPEVERICVTTWGDGEKISYTQASLVTNIGTAFTGNTTIEKFDEFKYFTGIVQLGTTSGSAQNAFNGCTNLQYLTYPPNLKIIGQRSSQNCSSLSRISINSEYTLVGTYSWSSCPITRVDASSLNVWLSISNLIGSSSTEGMGVYPFFQTDGHLYINGEEVKDLDLTGITNVGRWAFYRVKSLETVTIGNSVSVLKQAFNQCSNIKYVNIPDIETYMRCTFETNTSSFLYSSTYENRGLYINGQVITSVTVPQTITTVGTAMFYNNPTLTSITMHNDITSIGAYAFAGCTNLNTFTLPPNITTIGASAFYNCTSLVGDITIPNTVTSIGASSFAGCNAVSSLTFPIGGVASIFEFCCKNGTLTINGNLTGQAYHYIQGKNIIITGNVSNNQTTYVFDASFVETLRIQGNITLQSGILMKLSANSTIKMKFFEILGSLTRTAGQFFHNSNNLVSGAIMHFAYNGVICPPTYFCGNNLHTGLLNRASKIYVGDGSSQAADQAVLDQYLADDAWSAYSSKLDLWYNYTGEYKTT